MARCADLARENLVQRAQASGLGCCVCGVGNEGLNSPEVMGIDEKLLARMGREGIGR